jgi:hypothetical protein
VRRLLAVSSACAGRASPLARALAVVLVALPRWMALLGLKAALVELTSYMRAP